MDRTCHPSSPSQAQGPQDDKESDMELREYLKVIKKHLKLILGLGLVFGFLAFLVSSQLPPTYKALATLYVKREPEKMEGEYFTYEGFYSQQTAEKYTDTVLGFLKSKDIVKQALEEMGGSVTQREIKLAQKAVKVKKVAPQLINLTAVKKDGWEAEKLLEAVSQTTIKRVEALNKMGDKLISLDLVNPKPIVEKCPPKIFLNTIVCTFLGLFLGTLGAFLLEYFKS